MALVIAHRGASGLSPENTLAAFELAIAIGAHGIELDVQLAIDGVPVVIHDRTVNRTTNGAGKVSRLSWPDLARLDAGTWFEQRLSLRPRARKQLESVCAAVGRNRQSYTGEQIPTLESALALSARAGVAAVYLELKTASSSREGLLDQAVGLVRRFGLQRTVCFLSFDHEVIRLAKASAPDIRTAITVPIGRATALGSKGIVKAASRAQADEVALHFGLVTSRLVQVLHDHGLRASTWTVNRKLLMRRMAGCGVDSIMTNYPNRLISELESRQH
jgi:glycerophosphoryl diester phosphodiesterase